MVSSQRSTSTLLYPHSRKIGGSSRGSPPSLLRTGRVKHFRGLATTFRGTGLLFGDDKMKHLPSNILCSHSGP